MSEPVAAVVLRTTPLGEADIVVVLHTERWGKVRAAARAARRSKRRFAGGLPAGGVGEAVLHPGRSGGLWRIDGFVPRLDHSAIGRDLDRFAYVAYLCELADALVEEHHPEPGLHAALEQAIERTVALPVDPLVLRGFEVALLLHLGLLPAFESCCVCGSDLAGATIPFDPGRGGALCLAHGKGAALQPASLLGAAAALARGEAAGSLGPNERRALRDLLHRPIQAQLRAPLRSIELFQQLASPRAHLDTPHGSGR